MKIVVYLDPLKNDSPASIQEVTQWVGEAFSNTDVMDSDFAPNISSIEVDHG